MTRLSKFLSLLSQALFILSLIGVGAAGYALIFRTAEVAYPFALGAVVAMMASSVTQYAQNLIKVGSEVASKEAGEKAEEARRANR